MNEAIEYLNANTYGADLVTLDTAKEALKLMQTIIDELNNIHELEN